MVERSTAGDNAAPMEEDIRYHEGDGGAREKAKRERDVRFYAARRCRERGREVRMSNANNSRTLTLCMIRDHCTDEGWVIDNRATTLKIPRSLVSVGRRLFAFLYWFVRRRNRTLFDDELHVRNVPEYIRGATSSSQVVDRKASGLHRPGPFEHQCEAPRSQGQHSWCQGLGPLGSLGKGVDCCPERSRSPAQESSSLQV